MTDKSADVRKDATRVFQFFVVGHVSLSIGIVALGWWVGRWCRLGIGADVGGLVVAAGLRAGGMLYAMSQDSARYVSRPMA